MEESSSSAEDAGSDKVSFGLYPKAQHVSVHPLSALLPKKIPMMFASSGEEIPVTGDLRFNQPEMTSRFATPLLKQAMAHPAPIFPPDFILTSRR